MGVSFYMLRTSGCPPGVHPHPNPPPSRGRGFCIPLSTLDGRGLGRVDKIEIFVIPAKAGIYEDLHQDIIGLKTPGFRFKTGMTGYLSARPRVRETAVIS